MSLMPCMTKYTLGKTQHNILVHGEKNMAGEGELLISCSIYLQYYIADTYQAFQKDLSLRLY